MRRAPALTLTVASSALAVGCQTGDFHYTDDVKVQFSEKEEVASLKAQLGCEGAHPAEEKKEDKEAREKLIPETELGKAWLERACKLADDFDAAGPVTSWPEGDKAVWAGIRICRGQINRVVKAPDDGGLDPTAFAQMGRVEITKGAGKKLWADGPDVKKDRVLDFQFSATDVSFKVTAKKLPEIDAFFAALEAGSNPDVEALRKDEAAENRKTTDDTLAAVKAHTVPGMLLKSDGTSTLAYPVLGEKNDPSAIHYLRQSGSRLLVATPNIGASSPNACLAELTLQK